RTEYQLSKILGTGHNVAADEVGVVFGELCRGADSLADDAVAESWGKSLDLGDDGRGGIAGVSVGHVRVGPYGVDVADRALRVGQILLSDKDERPLRHPTGVHVPLGGGQFGVGACQV